MSALEVVEPEGAVVAAGIVLDEGELAPAHRAIERPAVGGSGRGVRAGSRKRAQRGRRTGGRAEETASAHRVRFCYGSVTTATANPPRVSLSSVSLDEAGGWSAVV